MRTSTVVGERSPSASTLRRPKERRCSLAGHFHRSGGRSAPPAGRGRRAPVVVLRDPTLERGRVLVIKRIANNRRVPLLHDVFPDARYIEIVRDGRAVALSISKVNWWGRGRVWWLGKSPDEWAAEGGDPLVLCARHWVREVETLNRSASAIDPERYLRVRYEDVVAAPHETLKKMALFVGLDPDDPGPGRASRCARIPQQESAVARSA